ncbi:hypothetical protein V8D89_005226 [Ganoderma adspersum]
MATNTRAAAWTIYAKQLYPQGYGYPLWQPDPDPKASPVDIADVGWLDKGGFFQLFNSRMKLEDASRQVHARVPEGFVPFDPPDLFVSGPHPSLVAPPLCSETIETSEVSGSAQVESGSSGVVSAGASFSFKCTANHGAFLMYSPEAYATDIKNEQYIINYIQEHFTHWMEFSQKLGLGLRDKDILFAVAAFQGNYNMKQGTFSVDLGSAGGMNMSVNISNQTLPQTYRKVGPKRTTIDNTGLARNGSLVVPLDAANESIGAGADDKYDQCVFINYYQAKRRVWSIRAMKAAAGSR